MSLPHIPPIPGVENAELYGTTSVNPDDFEDQRVLIIGKGNSAFETADNLIETASVIHVVGPNWNDRAKRVIVSAGHTAAWSDDWARLVPKRDLVGTLQVLLQSRRLQIASGLPEAANLERELLAFRAKTPAAGAETSDSWRERPHDDRVLAVAVTAWLGERLLPRSGPRR